MNRRWLLARRPEGKLSLDDFRYDEQPFVEPELAEGEILVQTAMFACAPTIRNWMNEAGRSYRGSIGIGQPIVGSASGVVRRSRHPAYPEGSRIIAVLGWQDYHVLAPDSSPTPVRLLADDVSFSEAMGIAGLNALTGYCGILEVGRAQAGDTVVVSAAAGSTGSVAAQVARIMGCRVIGIAGGADKCAWLVDKARLDAAIDYKSEDVSARLGELCPNGVDLFFDNVGGNILHAVMDNIAVHGRVVVCGQLSAYDGDAPAPGPRDMMKVVYWRVRIQGFVLGDHPGIMDRAAADLCEWHRSGQLAYRLDLREGFENLPATFIDLFAGGNQGGLVVRTMEGV